MLLWASVRFTSVSFKAFLFVSSDVRWKAPNRPRSEVIWLIASSTMLAAVVGSLSRSATPPEPSWNNLPSVPPNLAVFTLVMPMRACWLLTTSGPSWNKAPPPLIVKFTAVLEPAFTVSDRSSEAVLIDSLLPSPLA